MARYSNIIKIVVFELIFVILLLLSSFIFEPKSNMPKFGMHNATAMGILGEKEDSIDVIFVGDSIAYVSFFPLHMYEEQGFTSYTMGIAGQKMYETYNLLEQALKTQKPKLIVFETGPLVRGFKPADAINYELGKIFPVFEYHNRWKKLTINDFNMKVSYTYTSPTKGYKKKDKTVEGTDKNYMKKSSKITKLSERNTFYFDKIVDLCEENDVELMMVSSIAGKSMNYSRHKSYQDLAEKYGLNYIDLNLVDTIAIDWAQDFYDGGEHLNYQGAQKVSAYMGEYLRDNYDLPDHRNDKNYKSWDESLANFKKGLE